MKNETTMPATIIEWSGSRKFELLTASEQNLVLEYMSADGYDELHFAHKNASVYFAEDIKLKPSINAKQNLDKAFKQRHAKPKSVWLQPVAFWKVAAVFLVLFSASCLYLKKNTAAQNTAERLVHDTVFVEKKIDAIRHIIDTVVEYKYAGFSKSTSRKKSKQNLETLDDRHDTAMIYRSLNDDIGIRTLQPQDLEKQAQSPKGKSVYEDELIKRFSFARI